MDGLDDIFMRYMCKKKILLEVNQMNNVPFLWFTKAVTWLTDIEEINNVLFGYNMSNFLISSKTTWCCETVNLFRIDKRLLFVFCTCTLNKWWYFRILRETVKTDSSVIRHGTVYIDSRKKIDERLGNDIHILYMYQSILIVS